MTFEDPPKVPKSVFTKQYTRDVAPRSCTEWVDIWEQLNRIEIELNKVCTCRGFSPGRHGNN